MSEKTIVYYYDVCGLSPQDIAKKLNTDIEKIRQVLVKTPRYRPVYAPRMRYNGWVNGKCYNVDCSVSYRVCYGLQCRRDNLESRK